MGTWHKVSHPSAPQEAAKNMKPEQLEGVWLSPHIRVLLEERDTQLARNGCVGSDVFGNGAMRHIGGQGTVV
jgi:hypothetical protein